MRKQPKNQQGNLGTWPSEGSPGALQLSDSKKDD